MRLARQYGHSWVSEGTHDYCIDTWLAPDGYTATRRYYADGATTGQVLGDIEAGLSQLTYSGHGYEQGWSDGPPMDIGDVQGLGNACCQHVPAALRAHGGQQEHARAAVLGHLHRERV